jgi:hypothetical protein
MRSGRLDRKIEFPHPNEDARAKILRIHSRKMNVAPDVNFEELARSSDDFNAAQLKAVRGQHTLWLLHSSGDGVGEGREGGRGRMCCRSCQGKKHQQSCLGRKTAHTSADSDGICSFAQIVSSARLERSGAGGRST